jgi:hypothetical protein
VEPSTLQEYLAMAGLYREIVIQYLPEGFDLNSELQKVDPLLTYRGYLKFLLTDLRHKVSYQGLSKSKIKSFNENIAKQMIERGAVRLIRALYTFTILTVTLGVCIGPSKSISKFNTSLYPPV